MIWISHRAHVGQTMKNSFWRKHDSSNYVSESDEVADEFSKILSEETPKFGKYTV